MKFATASFILCFLSIHARRDDALHFLCCGMTGREAGGRKPRPPVPIAGSTLIALLHNPLTLSEMIGLSRRLISGAIHAKQQMVHVAASRGGFQAFRCIARSRLAIIAKIDGCFLTCK
jgi:hypothetical protein